MTNQYGDPSSYDLKIMRRPLEILPGSPDDYKVDDPPEPDSDEMIAGLEDSPEIGDDVLEQDDDVLHPFIKYTEENDLKVDEEYLDNLMEDVSTIAMNLKYEHNMPRPWQYTGIDEPKDTNTDTPSYPSGHSAQAKVAAEVLAGSYPEHKQQFEDIGNDVGLNRVRAGWHFPVDHDSGRDLADQILEKLPENTDMYLKKSGLGEEGYMTANMDNAIEILKSIVHAGETFSGYNKPKRTSKHPKKSHAVAARSEGKTKLIRFGQQGVSGEGKPSKSDSKADKSRRKSFKARHKKNIKRGKMSAAYWADKVKW